MKASSAVAALGLAATTLSGVAVAGQASAMAPGKDVSGYWAAVHNAAHYKTSASCLTNREGYVRTIFRNNSGSWQKTRILYKGGCTYNRIGKYWTYGHITYAAGAPFAVLKGDRAIWVK